MEGHSVQGGGGAIHGRGQGPGESGRGGTTKKGELAPALPELARSPLVPEHAAARGPGPPGLGALGVHPPKKAATDVPVPGCGRRASDLGRLSPSMSKGLSAAPHRRGAA